MEKEQKNQEQQPDPNLVYAIDYVLPNEGGTITVIVYRAYLKKPLTREELIDELNENDLFDNPLIDTDNEQEVDSYNGEVEIVSFVEGDQLSPYDIEMVNYLKKHIEK